MNFFDLHCDTLSELLNKGRELYENDLHVSMKRAKKYNKYIGCFAVWIPDEVRGESAMQLFNRAKDKLFFEHMKNEEVFSICTCFEDIKRLYESNNKIGVILTVEGGAVLGGKIENIAYLSKNGVRIMTLTWNGSCEIGDGIEVMDSHGLTEFGKLAIPEMENNRIIVDVSHASEKLFYDVCEIAKNPFIATHSNSKKICNHKRNLTDEQFKIISERGGIVGINFYKEFLSDRHHVVLDDIIRHVEHFLELGGENTIVIGSDFDGCEVLEEINGIEYVENLYEYFLKKNYNRRIVDKMFFDNAYKFMINNLKQR